MEDLAPICFGNQLTLFLEDFGTYLYERGLELILENICTICMWMRLTLILGNYSIFCIISLFTCIGFGMFCIQTGIMLLMGYLGT